ncbi:MAG: regulatory protein RecX [Phycisphaerae bacterium]|mgnify:FL=1|jgi:regulatory protein|nr:regulatory protein RecX [Phycisphaerae bacterium]
MTDLITAIEPCEEDPNFRDIFVQGKLAMTLTLAMVEQLELTVEQPWDDEKANELKVCTAIEHARHIAIDLISRRTWGCNEMITRLVKRGAKKDIAKQTVDQLVEDGWLDDHSFACALIRQWLRKEPAGRRWLLHKLYEKEIPSVISNGALDEELAEQSEQDLADAFAKKRIHKISARDEETLKRKLLAAMNRKGFNIDVALEAFSKAQNNTA